MSHLLPPPVIAAAIVAALFIPACLIALGFGPAAGRPPGRRFKLSVVAGLVGFVALARAMPGGEPSHPLDWLAAFCILIAMTLATFVVWSLIVWGFTLNMLLTLERSPHPLNLEGWADRYSGGRSIHQICLDRLGILIMFKLVQRDGDDVRLVATTGRLAAAASSAVRTMFGIPGSTR